MYPFIATLIFKIWGWKVIGQENITTPKSIMAVVPHATWLDLVVGLCAKPEIPYKIYFLGKAELFHGPFGWFFREMGGLPVERTKSTNLVDAVKKIFDQHETLHIGIAPEGTRKNVSELKSGFYYMAVKANVPLILVDFDYPNKKVVINKPFMPSGNFEEDKVKIAAHFYKTKGIQKDWIAKYLADK